MDNEIQELVAVSGDLPVKTSHGIAAIALQMAMKYHSMNMITDGALYQQYKLEGRNITTIGLADVFETAIQIEHHLLHSEERISGWVIEAIEASISEHGEQSEEPDVGETQE